jgi:GMP synthase-like glutamine amidotransferase
MRRVLFIQNGETDQPGLFRTVVESCGIELEIVHAWRGETVPASASEWDGVAVGGGSMSAFEQEQFPFLRAEEVLLRSAHQLQRPVLGMCLGAQLLASTFGGRVFRNRAKEIGFFEVSFTPAAESDRLWSGHTRPFQPVNWHQDTFSLPPGAVLLASSELTENQLFRLGEISYGFQFHLEINTAVLREMVTPEDEIALRSDGIDPQTFLNTAEIVLPRVEPLARTVFSRWAQLLTS